MPGLSRQATLPVPQESDMSEHSSHQESMARSGSRKASAVKQSSVAKKLSVAKQPSIAKQKSAAKQLSKKTTFAKQLSKKLSSAGRTSMKQQATTAPRQSSTASNKGVKRKPDDAPSSRKRVRKLPFVGDDAEAAPSKGKRRGKKGKKGKDAKPLKQLLYRRGEFLALRSSEDDQEFYIGQSLNYIWEDTERFRIHWLSNHTSTDKSIYYRNFPEHTDVDCIITHVHPKYTAIDTYQLSDKQKQKVLRELKKALKKQEGGSDSEDVENEEDEQKKKKTPKKKATKQTTLKKRGSLKKVVSTKKGKKSAKKKKVPTATLR